jgi:hypothetical protein
MTDIPKPVAVWSTVVTRCPPPGSPGSSGPEDALGDGPLEQAAAKTSEGTVSL